MKVMADLAVLRQRRDDIAESWLQAIRQAGVTSLDTVQTRGRLTGPQRTFKRGVRLPAGSTNSSRPSALPTGRAAPARRASPGGRGLSRPCHAT